MSTPKPGSVARRAVAQQAKDTAPVELDTMLGVGSTITLCGRAFTVYPVPLMNHAKLQAAMNVLGDDYLMPALAQDNPGALERIAKLMGSEGAELTDADLTIALRLASASLTEDQVEAMLDVCEVAFNPLGETVVAREEIGRYVTARAFPAVLRTVLDCSGLNPTPPR